MNNFGEKVSFIWSVADLIRGPYRPNQYKDVMLPLTVLRRLDCVLESTKDAVLSAKKQYAGKGAGVVDAKLTQAAGRPFYNTSRFTFQRLKGDPNNIAANLTHFINGFSSRAREVIEHFGFEEHIGRLDKADRLFLVVSRFCEIDLNPQRVSNIEMGYIFEELVRKFNEASNEEAGDHFTPREVIRLMVDLLFLPDGDSLTRKGIVKTLYDPACGTGGMLSVAEDYVRDLNPNARMEVFGQDYNPQAYAICGSDMIIKGQDIANIAFGDSFTDDHFRDQKFDYMLANPPFGVEWKPQEKVVRKEHEEQGFGGRFGAGLPRINDGSLLFLQHMVAKMKAPKEGGTRLAIVFNGSPLFTGAAGSGESEIRRWIIENDWLEGIVALPDQLFYNTGIYTYLWILSNRKEPHRKGKVQMLNATGFFRKMRKSLGNKRNEMDEAQREEIARLYGDFSSHEYVRIFDNEDFGSRRITVERPLRLSFSVTPERLERLRAARPFAALAESKKRKDPKAAETEIAEGGRLQTKILAALASLESQPTMGRAEFTTALEKALDSEGVKVAAPVKKAILAAIGERDEAAQPCLDLKGSLEPDPDLRDFENVPLKEDIHEYMRGEVLPHVPDAWVDESKTKVGYEINFNRYFYKYVPPRPLAEIEADLKGIEREIANMLEEVTHA
ncbi:MAG: type I restriction-modification system subunit M [Leptospirales bacterium]|nr:type I restriction-modification system subunit M [Leptospirales bacterium]